MSHTVTVTDANARLSELVAAVAATHDHIEITRNGELAAVLISAEVLNALRETIAILADDETVEDIREGETDIAAGRLTDAEGIRETMVARRRLMALPTTTRKRER